MIKHWQSKQNLGWRAFIEVLKIQILKSKTSSENELLSKNSNKICEQPIQGTVATNYNLHPTS